MINSIVSSTVADMKKSAAPFATPLPISQILTAKKKRLKELALHQIYSCYSPPNSNFDTYNSLTPNWYYKVLR